MRTVALDPERAPLVKLAFELYATGEHTLQSLARTLTLRGLRTRGDIRRPGGPIAISRLGSILRDRYYLGYVSYGGEDFPGRHEP